MAKLLCGCNDVGKTCYHDLEYLKQRAKKHERDLAEARLAVWQKGDWGTRLMMIITGQMPN